MGRECGGGSVGEEVWGESVDDGVWGRDSKGWSVK